MLRLLVTQLERTERPILQTGKLSPVKTSSFRGWAWFQTFQVGLQLQDPEASGGWLRKGGRLTCFCSSPKLSHMEATILDTSPKVALGFCPLMAA